MNARREQFLFYSMIAMLAALFISRAMLSVFTILFIILSFLHRDIKTHFRNFISSPLLWSMSLLFVLPFLSGLWSEDKQEWLQIVRIKLPLFFLPLSFAGPFSFSRKQWNLLAYIFIGLITAATLWSMFEYSLDVQAINKSYLKAKSIITPLENDRVRFSWLIAIAILLSGKTGWHFIYLKKGIAWLWIALILWLIIFLHILAVRIGLIVFYVIAITATIWLIIKKIKRNYAIVALLSLFILPYIAYRVLPSFHNRVDYFIYDYSYFKEIHYLPGGNDALRVISLTAGWNVLNKNPAMGVGAGDVFTETKKWYIAQYPQMQPADMLYPSSNWLLYGDACGWPGLILFACIMSVPFFIPRRHRTVWLLLNFATAFSLLFDVGLEVQFGVFIYSFIVLWWWKWLSPENGITLKHD